MEDENGVKPMMSDALYDRLNFVAKVLLPGVGALYFALSQIWGLPKGEEVVGTITAIDVFLGLLLVRANGRYLESDEWADGFVEAKSLPEQLAGRKRVNMKVRD